MVHWQTVFTQTYAVDEATERIILPATFSPYFRLILGTTLISGLGQDEPFLGTVSQHLIMPDYGDVKGQEFPLSPSLQLLTPATEFPYKLVYQPVKRQFSLTLTIQVEATIGAISGTDNAPVLEAIANLHTQLDSLPVTSGTDNAPVLEAIANLHTQLDSLPVTSGTDNAPVLEAIANLHTQLDSLPVAIDYTPLLNAIQTSLTTLSTEQTELNAHLLSLETAIAQRETAIQTSLDVIRVVLTTPTPTSTPTPTPTPTPSTPSAAGVAYTASQSSDYSGRVGTYANLTDGDGTTGTITFNQIPAVIKASYPYPVVVTSVTVGGGNLANIGPVADSLNGAKVQASTDNANWVDVWTVAGVADSGVNQFKTFTLSAPLTAQYWRLFSNTYNMGTSEFRFT